MLMYENHKTIVILVILPNFVFYKEIIVNVFNSVLLKILCLFSMVKTPSFGLVIIASY
jgi:hypothetical protein